MKLKDGSIICSVCRGRLTPENASPYNFRPDNRQPTFCRVCQNDRQKRKYRELPSVRQYYKKYQREHPEYAKRWYEQNRDLVSKRQYKRYWANPEVARAKALKYYYKRKATGAL